jgi:hypothetical protein
MIPIINDQNIKFEGCCSFTIFSFADLRSAIPQIRNENAAIKDIIEILTAASGNFECGPINNMPSARRNMIIDILSSVWIQVKSHTQHLCCRLLG